MNLTLSIDQRVLEKARATAGTLGLSLNEMVRRYLEQVAGTGDQADTFQEFRDLCTTRGGHSAGRAWTREGLHRD
jgi:hypothetical protein